MWGRGTSDSKVGAAIFCHIATRLAPVAERLHGRVVLLFDVDEHTGHFGGAKRYFEGPGAPTDVAGVMIGYPGLDTLIVGGRGVFRARLRSTECRPTPAPAGRVPMPSRKPPSS
jgi:succinyl-diaminopimelate desuccinylase